MTWPGLRRPATRDEAQYADPATDSVPPGHGSGHRRPSPDGGMKASWDNAAVPET